MPRLTLRSALVVTKTTRWETITRKFAGLTKAEIEEKFRKRGLPRDRIKMSHDTHHASLEMILKGLSQAGCDSIRVVQAQGLTPAHLEGVDAVLTAGGDGTVLEAAACIGSSELPVISVNTDPVLSTGFLCAAKITPSLCFKRDVMDRLRDGEFEWLMRSRIRIRLNQRESYLPRLALNEMLMADSDPSRPTVHETTTSPDQDPLVQRSSGCIVCTGTGSTAWMSSASMVSKHDLDRIFRANNQILEAHELDKVCEIVNSDCIYAPDSRQLQYFVREPVMNGWYGRHDEPLSATPRRGFTEEISLKSLGWGDTSLILDGLHTYKIAYGTIVQAAVAPLEQSLRTVKFK